MLLLHSPQKRIIKFIMQLLKEVHLMSLEELISTHPVYIPILAAAEVLHMKPEALRASIEQGRCPFRFSWKIGDRSGYKIPTATFVAWFTKGTYPLPV